MNWLIYSERKALSDVGILNLSFLSLFFYFPVWLKKKALYILTKANHSLYHGPCVLLKQYFAFSKVMNFLCQIF